MEKKLLGTMPESKNNSKEVQTTAIEFSDDGDFFSSGVESERKMEKIVDCYATIHTASRDKAQK